MTTIAGYCDTKPARRLIKTIALLQGLSLVLIALGTLLAAFAASASGGGFVILVLLYGAIAGVSTFVVFGWLEQTLELLVGIAFNTAEGADMMDLEPDTA